MRENGQISKLRKNAYLYYVKEGEYAALFVSREEQPCEIRTGDYFNLSGNVCY